MSFYMGCDGDYGGGRGNFVYVCVFVCKGSWEGGRTEREHWAHKILTSLGIVKTKGTKFWNASSDIKILNQNNLLLILCFIIFNFT